MSFDVKKISDLARLKLSDEEMDSFSKELAQIVEWVKLLEEIPFSGDTLPFEFDPQKENPLRKDLSDKNKIESGLQNNSPSMEGPHLKVPSILSQGKK